MGVEEVRVIASAYSGPTIVQCRSATGVKQQGPLPDPPSLSLPDCRGVAIVDIAGLDTATTRKRSGELSGPSILQRRTRDPRPGLEKNTQTKGGKDCHSHAGAKENGPGLSGGH